MLYKGKYMRKDPLRIQSHVLLGFLVVQYILGITVNLFIQFPNTKSESALWEFSKSQPAIMFHIILGGLLLIGACVFMIRAARSKNKQWIISASVGLLAILVAVITGAKFIPTQEASFSFTMALAFIVAVIAYGWGIYKTKQ